MDIHASPVPSRFELRFISLFDSGRGLSFPCDAGGQVDLDVLGECARSNYLYARALIGREFMFPSIQNLPVH
jgi:hypothetical protein